MLSEQQCRLIEQGLVTEVEPRKVAAYLCLHMGLTLAEAAGLRWQDINLDEESLYLHNVIGKPENGGISAPVELIPSDNPRTLPMPPQVARFLTKHNNLYKNGDCFVMSGDMSVPAFYRMQNILTSICKQYKVADSLSTMDLRNAFIRRCIQSGVDLYSLCVYVGIKQPSVITKRFARFFLPKLKAVKLTEKYSSDYTPRPGVEPDGPRRMNLLILGAGSQGPVVKEIAEAIGVFNEIAFLDDDPDNKLAIGPLSDYNRLSEKFPTAIPSFGDPALRTKWYEKLRTDAGYVVPKLIHPSATISNSNVKLGDGVVVEAKVIIGSSVTVGDNVILSAGCVLDKECAIGANTHIGCSCTITKGSVVPPFSRIPSGTIYGR